MPKITVPAALQRVTSLANLPGVPAARPDRPQWCVEELSGRLTELSGLGASAQLSLACSLIREAQQMDDPVAWISTQQSTFFPPDASTNGIDLERLAVVFVPDATAIARAADRLLRSGGFGLLLLDLVGVRGDLPPALLSRLGGLALKHDAVVLCLTGKTAQTASLGPLVSLRCQATRRAHRQQFACLIEAIKDKKRGPGWTHQEVHHGPPGLR